MASAGLTICHHFSRLNFKLKEKSDVFQITIGLPFKTPPLPRRIAMGVTSRPAHLAATSVAVEVLDGRDDEYDGVVIESSRLPSNPNNFASLLLQSLRHWKSKGKKGIWLKLLEHQAHLVPIAIQEGFRFHHAEVGYVMLSSWIPGDDDEVCLLPSGPSHQIGVAGFAMDPRTEKVLVVKEKKCSCSCSGVWKLPIGYITKSEELFSGAIREVREETGIVTRFVEVVAFRHVQEVAFEKSDILFFCILDPLSFQIQIDPNEILDAKWASVDELLGQQFYEEDEMFSKAIQICVANREPKKKKKNYSGGFIAHQVVSKFDAKLSYLYFNP